VIKNSKIFAVEYMNKKEAGQASFNTIGGLGAGGNGVTLLPFVPAAAADSSVAGKPRLEYQVDDLKPGPITLLVKCLPTQCTGSNGLLRYSVSVNNDEPRMVNIHTESESRAWKENVLRGYALGRSKHTIATAGKTTIRVYFIDPGLVINELQIE